MHVESLPSSTRALLEPLRQTILDHGFVLAGGTALALHLGHRLSRDLDFFARRPFSTEKIYQKLKKHKLRMTVLQETTGTLIGIIEGVKVSLLHYPYPFAEKPVSFQGIPVAGRLDIAAMKVIAISQRGAKRDFVDLYFVLKDTPFRKIAETMIKRFGKERFNPVNIGKSLVYFKDAESDPDPKYLKKNHVSWAAVRRFFIGNIQQMVLDLSA